MRSKSKSSTPSKGKSGGNATGWPSRRAAADILVRIVEEGKDMDQALAASHFFEKLEGSDRGFARAIASAALRAFGRIDEALEKMLERPLEKMDPPVLALLRAGCAQLWVLKTPAYAVVDATVEAARRWKPASRGGGLVNAILRRADREPAAYFDLPAHYIWPEWLSNRFIETLGEDTTDAIANVQLQDPRIDLTVKSDAQAWADKLQGELLKSGSVRLPSGTPITSLPGYKEGDWWVQDCAATLPVKLFSPLTGKSVADLCAAPGGKTMQLANSGADVTAVDTSASRMKTVQENLARTGLEATLVTQDARDWSPDTHFDAILLDAPCSALGTLRRHPEGAWRRSEADLERYPKIQTELLDAAYECLKPGGELVYCVCTPLPAEGHDVVAAAISSQKWSILPITPEDVPGFAHGIDDQGGLLTTPESTEKIDEHFESSDIFYIARLKKT